MSICPKSLPALALHLHPNHRFAGKDSQPEPVQLCRVWFYPQYFFARYSYCRWSLLGMEYRQSMWPQRSVQWWSVRRSIFGKYSIWNRPTGKLPTQMRGKRKRWKQWILDGILYKYYDFPVPFEYADLRVSNISQSMQSWVKQIFSNVFAASHWFTWSQLLVFHRLIGWRVAIFLRLITFSGTYFARKPHYALRRVVLQSTERNVVCVMTDFECPIITWWLYTGKNCGNVNNKATRTLWYTKSTNPRAIFTQRTIWDVCTCYDD